MNGLTVAVYCTAATGVPDQYHQLAYDTGLALAAQDDIVVYGAGRVGMMGDLGRGVRAGNGHTVGIIPRSMMIREMADSNCTELVIAADMAERKREFIARSSAHLVLPGGLGTADELFEVWSQGALGLHAAPIVLLDPWNDFGMLIEWVHQQADAGFLSAWARDRIFVRRSIHEALAACGTGPVHGGLMVEGPISCNPIGAARERARLLGLR